jgi:hypothetical protein
MAFGQATLPPRSLRHSQAQVRGEKVIGRSLAASGGAVDPGGGIMARRRESGGTDGKRLLVRPRAAGQTSASG